MAKKSETNSYQDKRLDQMDNSMRVINHEMGVIKEDMSIVKTEMKWLKTESVKIRTALEEIRDKINKRPTWILTSAFSILLSATVGLVVYLLTH